MSPEYIACWNSLCTAVLSALHLFPPKANLKVNLYDTYLTVSTVWNNLVFRWARYIIYTYKPLQLKSKLFRQFDLILSICFQSVQYTEGHNQFQTYTSQTNKGSVSVELL